MVNFPIEGRPAADQKRRLERLLHDLAHLCYRHQIALDTSQDDLRLIDMQRERVIGFGLQGLAVAGYPIEYEACDSILDGAWPVDTPSGIVEQREWTADDQGEP